MIGIVCSQDNDLFEVLRRNDIQMQWFESVDSALEVLPNNAGLMILADDYPHKTVTLSHENFQAIRQKGLRVYLEYPSIIPGQETDDIDKIKFERGVISSEVFGDSLAMQILAIHGCHYVKYSSESPHIAVARVAGFDKAIYGLPEKYDPILFELTSENMLVATTKLSQFVTARYAPKDAWQNIWRWIIKWVDEKNDVSKLTWTDTVRPTYGSDEQLDDDVEMQAMRRGADWFKHAKLFIHSDWELDSANTDDLGEDEIPSGNDILLPVPPENWQCGDGSMGMIEGADATIHWDGSQLWRYCIRNDCICETSMAMAISGYLNDISVDKQIAANLNDYIYFNSIFAKELRADSSSESYGLITWTSKDPSGGVYYGDDNARAILGSLVAAAVLNENRWDEAILKCIVANLRTTGTKGFRGSRWEDDDLQKVGWRKLWNGDIENYSPHFESWLWACFLWAYDKTGFIPLLDRAVAGISNMMAGYPDKWVWTNGIQQERARMLLPLSWLVRVDDTPEHRAWLKLMTTELLSNQAECGAICEEIGSAGKGKYGPPKSNTEYGTKEAPLIQENGNPLCDLLYTANFAFVGLHEAAHATGESFYGKAADRLAEFLCRIQVCSEKHPELDGAWFRAFEFERWEYWASNSDLGWGAWCIESGWTQAWLVTILGLRQIQKSLWEITANTGIKNNAAKVMTEMFPHGY